MPHDKEMSEQEEQIRSDAISTFNTDQGARYLRLLMNRNFIFDSTASEDPGEMNRNEGRRQAILQILGDIQVLSVDASELLGLRDQSITDYVNPGDATQDDDPLKDT